MTAAPGGDTAGAVLVGAMWSYASRVLQPAQAAKRMGLTVVGPPEGDDLLPAPSPGLGPYFSLRHREPVLLDHPGAHHHLVEEFDRMSEAYDAYVRPFSTPIFDEAMRALEPYVRPDSRVLDAGCGPGRELRRVARTVPDGEVVGVDLAADMIRRAHEGAWAAGLDNTAFFQADVGDLPEQFAGQFDVVYNCLAHHHYPEPAAAAASVLVSLRAGGVYAIVDPGPAWFNALSAPLARWADPGWAGFHSPQQFRSLLLGAGFARVRWEELLPGFGLVLGQKA